jgi:CRP-like cAMP-binding protein
MKVMFVEKGEYLFKKGDRGTCAYLILHGDVIFLSLNYITWRGTNPSEE